MENGLTVLMDEGITLLGNEKGRPKFFIPRAQLVGLRFLSFTWKLFQKCLVCRRKQYCVDGMNLVCHWGRYLFQCHR